MSELSFNNIIIDDIKHIIAQYSTDDFNLYTQILTELGNISNIPLCDIQCNLKDFNN